MPLSWRSKKSFTVVSTTAAVGMQSNDGEELLNLSSVLMLLAMGVLTGERTSYAFPFQCTCAVLGKTCPLRSLTGAGIQITQCFLTCMYSSIVQQLGNSV